MFQTSSVLIWGEKMDYCAKEFGSLTNSELYEILRARAQIFLLEQGIVCQDMDRTDYRSLHCMVLDGDSLCGYLRAYLSDDKSSAVIGRVLTIRHCMGVGRFLAEKSIQDIKRHFGVSKITVYAQRQAEGFYSKLGFTAVSDEYTKEGIPHITMELEV